MTLKAIPQRPWLYYEVMVSDNLMICPECNGTGASPEYADLNLDLYNVQLSWGRAYNNLIFVWCSKCYGAGYIDWIDNIVGIQAGMSGKLFTDLRWNCVEFLLMLLSGSPVDYEEATHYESGIHVVYGWDIDVDQGLDNFNRHKSIVSKYLEEGDRDWLNAIINDAMAVQGRACTKCFRLVPDEILIERCKKTHNLLPVMPGDEVDYKTLIAPERDYPLFRLCDSCQENMTQSEMAHLKRVAFDKNDPEHFSAEFRAKIDSLTFSERHI